MNLKKTLFFLLSLTFIFSACNDVSLMKKKSDTETGPSGMVNKEMLLSSEKDITVFDIQGINETVTISANSISIVVPFATNISSLIPNITISTGASVSPLSGVAHNFIAAVPYTVTAEDGTTKVYTVTVIREAGQVSSYDVDGVEFKMVSVPGGLTFPYSSSGPCPGCLECDSATVNNAYWIGKTEVSNKLWKKVSDWATNNGYHFSSGYGSDTTDKPMTFMGSCDAIVFSNALTDFINHQNGTNLTFAYKDAGGNVMKDARYSTNLQGCKDVVQNDPFSTGFRLLTDKEWRLAARYLGKTQPSHSYVKRMSSAEVIAYYENLDPGNGWMYGCSGIQALSPDYYWLPYNYASGAMDNVSNIQATKAVAWFGATTTKEVDMGVAPNALGLYHMNGNVCEWLVDSTGNDGYVHQYIGAHYGLSTSGYMAVDGVGYYGYGGGPLGYGRPDTGLRLGRNDL